MKKLCIGFLLLAAISCKKGGSVLEKGPDLSGIKAWLKDSIGVSKFDSLNFGDGIFTTTNGGKTWFYRVPFLGADVTTRFILVNTDSGYHPVKAAGIEIARVPTPQGIRLPSLGFYGSIRKTWLNGLLDYSSSINGGYIQVKHRVIPEIEPAAAPIELPEVVIYAPDPDYYASYDLLLDDGGGDFGGYSPSAPGGSGGGSGSASSGLSYSQAVLNELQASKPGINLAAYIICFNTVPDDAATTYSASLLVKVPDPANPDIMWDAFGSGGVGHAFLQLTKTNGSNSVTQYIGFYGQGGAYAAATSLGFSVPSKMVDNSGHPYNASLTVNLTGSQFSSVLYAVQDYSGVNYNLSSFNCATFAMGVLNNVLPQALSPDPMAIPGQVAGDTPNGLFIEMQGMPANGPDGQVKISGTAETAGTGHGPC